MGGPREFPLATSHPDLHMYLLSPSPGAGLLLLGAGETLPYIGGNRQTEAGDSSQKEQELEQELEQE